MGERNDSEETEEIKTFPSTFICYKDNRFWPTVSQCPINYEIFFSVVNYREKRTVLEAHCEVLIHDGEAGVKIYSHLPDNTMR